MALPISQWSVEGEMAELWSLTGEPQSLPVTPPDFDALREEVQRLAVEKGWSVPYADFMTQLLAPPPHAHDWVTRVEPLMSNYSEYWRYAGQGYDPNDAQPVHVSKVFCAVAGCTARPDEEVKESVKP